jgi:AcrR family transcriptional regulator
MPTQPADDATTARPAPARRARPRRSPDPRAVRSREAALAAARELLAEQGLAAVTHVTVAARSGVGRTTLYRHWPDVPALLRDALQPRIPVAGAPPTGNLRADLVQALSADRALLQDPVSERILRALIEGAGTDPGLARMVRELHDEGSEPIRAVLADAISTTALPAGLDIELAVEQLAGPLMFRRLIAGQPIDPGYVERVVDTFLLPYPDAAAR